LNRKIGETKAKVLFGLEGRGILVTAQRVSRDVCQHRQMGREGLGVDGGINNPHGSGGGLGVQFEGNQQVRRCYWSQDGWRTWGERRWGSGGTGESMRSRVV
jgi:hypothetical protein